MPNKALSSPASVAASTQQSGPGIISPVQSNDATNFTILLSGYRAGVVSAAIQNGSVQGARVVVELETFPGDFLILGLHDPANPDDPPRDFLVGPGAAGWARTAAFKSVRIRRLDLNGGSCVVSMEFREGSY